MNWSKAILLYSLRHQIETKIYYPCIQSHQNPVKWDERFLQHFLSLCQQLSSIMWSQTNSKLNWSEHNYLIDLCQCSFPWIRWSHQWCDSWGKINSNITKSRISGSSNTKLKKNPLYFNNNFNNITGKEIN